LLDNKVHFIGELSGCRVCLSLEKNKFAVRYH
jgi:hypothetical protein